jgi:5-methylcytosine-specific restriction endonuclease McrA
MSERRTLLLAPWYFPMKVLRWEDAVKMIYEGTADVVVEYDEEIRSPSVTWMKPAVIRLRKLARERHRNTIRFSRINVYTRDDFCCQYCGQRFSIAKLSYDHVVPKSAGGRRTWNNIVTACKPCNLRKADRTCDEAGMWPKQPPRQPEKLRLLGPIIDPETAPEEWQDYLGAWAR